MALDKKTIVRCGTLLFVGAVVAGFVVAVIRVALPVFTGLEVSPDKPPTTAAELARLASDATQYLVGLATAVLGLVGLLMSEKLLSMRAGLSLEWRCAVGVGALLVGLSLLTGFVAQWVVLRSSVDAVVRFGLDHVLWLHTIQLVELGLGVGFVGAAFLKFIVTDGLHS